MGEPENFRPEVRALYEALPFPLRKPKEEDQRLMTPLPDLLARINHYCFAGMQNFGPGFRALVAGGGTGDAAIFLAAQMQARGGSVTYLDMSEASMRIARERAARRGLSNIDWVHASILDLPKLGLGTFDYINCVGVIHHMDDPRLGFCCLESVLASEGAIALMVYGKYGRQHITVVQELTRLIFAADTGLGDAVAMTRELLAGLPPTNLHVRGRDRAEVMARYVEDSANLADTFLHPCDQPFSVTELQDMIEAAGLHLAAFTSYDGNPAVTRLQYDPSVYLKTPELRAKAAARSLREQRQIAEILDGSLSLHTAYVTRRRDPVASFSAGNIPFVPHCSAELMLSLLHRRSERGIALQLSNYTQLPVRPGAATLRFLAALDGQRSIQEILAHVAPSSPDLERLQQDIALLNALDWILVRSPAVDPFPVAGDPIEFDAAASGEEDWVLPYCEQTVQARPL